ncbi:putative protein S-acyltransferase 17 [Datura stramonium]|uniref:Uncharacterized protein n=1 Tax=Datura stramonium TaxID=4076 RepID=A0ABS8V2V7_DATST|nr:putative protein S-acyltransferase 17 [Datura stramonium]
MEQVHEKTCLDLNLEEALAQENLFEEDEGFLDQRYDASSVGSVNELKGLDCQSYASTQGEFINADEVWLLDSYNTQILIMVFLAIVSMLLAGFLAYHTKLCVTNTTTNETFKWQEYLSWKRKVNEAKASAAALKASLSELNHEKKHPVSKCKAFFQRSRLEEVEVVKNNIYDKGMLQNVFEIVVPLSTRQSFLQRKAKSG